MLPIKIIPINQDYLEFWHRLHNDPATRQHQPIQPTTLAEQSVMLNRFVGHDLTNNTLPSYKWILVEPEHNQPIGMTSFHRLQIEQGIGRIGYSILPQFWGKGYATQAVHQLISLIFSKTNMERLEAVCSIHNPASKRVLEKAGFIYEGVRRDYLRIRDERIDHHSYAILKSDWLAK